MSFYQKRWIAFEIQFSKMIFLEKMRKTAMAKRKLHKPWWKRSWETLQTAWRDLFREWNQPACPERHPKRHPEKRRANPRKPQSPKAEKEALDKDLLGRQGEDEAVRFLKAQGYRILERNLQFRLGELDIIAQKGDCIAFIEVKTRRTDESGQPFEAVKPAKMRRIISMAETYLRREKLENSTEFAFRFDIISIVWPEGEPPRIQHLENAFDANAKYRRIV